MNRSRLTTAGEIGGLALISAGTFMLEWWLGLIVTGVLVVVLAGYYDLTG